MVWEEIEILSKCELEELSKEVLLQYISEKEEHISDIQKSVNIAKKLLENK